MAKIVIEITKVSVSGSPDYIWLITFSEPVRFYPDYDEWDISKSKNDKRTRWFCEAKDELDAYRQAIRSIKKEQDNDQDNSA